MYLVISLIITGIVFYSIDSYNNRFGGACEIDSNCHFECGKGVISNRYLSLEDYDPLGPFFAVACFYRESGRYTPLCIDNRCDWFDIEEANSVEECARVKESYIKDECLERVKMKGGGK